MRSVFQSLTGNRQKKQYLTSTTLTMRLLLLFQWAFKQLDNWRKWIIIRMKNLCLKIILHSWDQHFADYLKSKSINLDVLILLLIQSVSTVKHRPSRTSHTSDCHINSDGCGLGKQPETLLLRENNNKSCASLKRS